MIQRINFNCVYGKAMLEETSGGKKKSRKHRMNVRIQKVDQIKDDFRLLGTSDRHNGHVICGDPERWQ